mmetsp:Transcript_7870/g.27500  ORF Transcript_7870/g.27500 Transcript_7870/m.27500 type:complete len:205 (+) Transcript_7870:1113-1727(+)
MSTMSHSTRPGKSTSNALTKAWADARWPPPVSDMSTRTFFFGAGAAATTAVAAASSAPSAPSAPAAPSAPSSSKTTARRFLLADARMSRDPAAAAFAASRRSADFMGAVDAVNGPSGRATRSFEGTLQILSEKRTFQRPPPAFASTTPLFDASESSATFAPAWTPRRTRSSSRAASLRSFALGGASEASKSSVAGSTVRCLSRM